MRSTPAEKKPTSTTVLSEEQKAQLRLITGSAVKDPATTVTEAPGPSDEDIKKTVGEITKLLKQPHMLAALGKERIQRIVDNVKAFTTAKNLTKLNELLKGLQGVKVPVTGAAASPTADKAAADTAAAEKAATEKAAAATVAAELAAAQKTAKDLAAKVQKASADVAALKPAVGGNFATQLQQLQKELDTAAASTDSAAINQAVTKAGGYEAILRSAQEESEKAFQASVQQATALQTTVDGEITKANALKPAPAGLLKQLQDLKTALTTALSNRAGLEAQIATADPQVKKAQGDLEKLAQGRKVAKELAERVEKVSTTVASLFLPVPTDFDKQLRGLKAKAADVQKAEDVGVILKEKGVVETDLTNLLAAAKLLKTARQNAAAVVPKIAEASTAVVSLLGTIPPSLAVQLKSLQATADAAAKGEDPAKIDSDVKTITATLTTIPVSAQALKDARGKVNDAKATITTTKQTVATQLNPVPRALTTELDAAQLLADNAAAKDDAAQITNDLKQIELKLASVAKTATELKTARDAAATALAELDRAIQEVGKLRPVSATAGTELGNLKTTVSAVARGDTASAIDAKVKDANTQRPNIVRTAKKEALRAKAQKLLNLSILPAADANKLINPKDDAEIEKNLNTANQKAYAEFPNKLDKVIGDLKKFKMSCVTYLDKKKKAFEEDRESQDPLELFDTLNKFDTDFRDAYNRFMVDYNKVTTGRNDLGTAGGFADRVKDLDKTKKLATDKLESDGPDEAKVLIEKSVSDLDKALEEAKPEKRQQTSDKARTEIETKSAAQLKTVPVKDRLALLRSLRRVGKLNKQQRMAQRKLYESLELDAKYEEAEAPKRQATLSAVKTKMLTAEQKVVIKDWDGWKGKGNEAAQNLQKEQRRAELKAVDWSNWQKKPTAKQPPKDMLAKKKLLEEALKLQCTQMGADVPIPEVVFDPPSPPERTGPNRTTTNKGRFSPNDGKIHLNPDPDGVFSDFPDALDTILHENTHNYQSYLVKLLEEGKLPESDPRYTQALIFQMNNETGGYVDTEDDEDKTPQEKLATHAAYEGQPVEAEAWKVGGAATRMGEEVLAAIKAEQPKS